MEGTQGQTNKVFKSTNIHASKASAKVDYFNQKTEAGTGKSKTSLRQRNINIFGKNIPLFTIIIAAIAVLVIVGIIIGIILINNPAEEANNTNNQGVLTEYDDAEERDPNAPLSLADQASDTLKSSGLEAFLATYQSAIDATQDNTEKADIYLDRSENLFSHYLETNEESYRDQALQDALTAEDLSRSALSANNLATIYYAIGDNAGGDSYYSLYEERAAIEYPDTSDDEEGE